MTIITLTTDFGNKDFFVPSLKGYIYSHIPSVTIVDISHQITPFRPIEASFVLRNCYKDFPDNTIHIISIESSQHFNDDFILTEWEKHFFLAHNNGVISLITDGNADKIIRLQKPVESVLFPAKEILAPAACKLAKDFKTDDMGEPLSKLDSILSLNPVLEKDFIRGTIIYIDNYGNAITNISRSHIDRYDKSKKPLIQFSARDSVDKIRKHYTDVPEGETVCLYGTTGLLEISANKGNASKLFGLSVSSRVLIEFV